MKALLPWGTRTFVMGILNVTPDSFSGDGLLDAADPITACLVKARQFAKDGVDILDVGAESTRPGAQAISLEEELRRILPVARALAAEELTTFDGRRILLSVDTYKSAVAEAALSVGFDWINDVWGLRADVAVARVVARFGAGLVLMDNRSRAENVDFQVQLGGRYTGQAYEALFDDIKANLIESVKLARSAGVQDAQIILDPGIGFGKTVEQNLDLINRLDVIRALNFPVLVGPSRKGFIGYTLHLPKEDRLEGTAAAVAVGIARGADIIRVHDVAAMVRVARMTDAIVRRSGAM